MISQITPDGFRPASRARSTPASVWPARSSTPPRAALEREDVAGLHEVPRAALGGSIATWIVCARSCGRDPGRDALARLDRHGEGVSNGRFVLRRHQVEPELVAALGGERQADQPAALLGHEVDRLGRRELRGERQVALVLAVLVVADHDHPPCADLVERLLDRGEWRANALSSRCDVMLAPRAAARRISPAHRPRG